MNRREFVAASAALGVSGMALGAIQKEKLFDISLAQWSLHKAFFAKQKDAGDFAKISKEEYGIHAIEYVNQFYKEKKNDDAYVKTLRKKADDLGVRSVLIMCDGEGQLGDADVAKRKKAVENHYRWVEWAKALGCHSIRVNAASSGSYQEQMDRASDGLRQLSEWAGKMQIGVIVENHGGLSSNGAWLAATIKKVGLKGCGTLPDFGNFRVSKDEEYDRYKGVEELMPYAKGVSAKSHDFDAKGNETKTDYRRMMKIVMAANYHGYVGVEYEGSKLSEPEGIKATKKLLETVRTELAGGASRKSALDPVAHQGLRVVRRILSRVRGA